MAQPYLDPLAPPPFFGVRDLRPVRATPQVRGRAEEALQRGEDTVSITVGSGDNLKRFSIHERLLSKHSQLFQEIFGSQDWLAMSHLMRQIQTVTLPTDDPEAFELFENFVYDNRIYSIKSTHDQQFESLLDFMENDEEWTRLWNAWELAQKLQSTSFKDAITDTVQLKIKEDCQGRVPVHAYQHIYALDSRGSGLRKLLADAALDWPAETLQAQQEEAEAYSDFFFDVAVAATARTDRIRAGWLPGDASPCTFHEHGHELCYPYLHHMSRR